MVETGVLCVARVVANVPKEVPNTTTKYLQGGNHSNHGISVEKWKIKIKNKLHPYKPQKNVQHLQSSRKKISVSTAIPTRSNEEEKQRCYIL